MALPWLHGVGSVKGVRPGRERRRRTLIHTRESIIVNSRTQHRAFLLLGDADSGVSNASELNGLIEANYRVRGIKFEAPNGFLVDLERELAVHDGGVAERAEHSIGGLTH